MVFTKNHIAYLDQKTIFIEQALKDLKRTCKKFQDDSGSSNSELNDISLELANL